MSDPYIRAASANMDLSEAGLVVASSGNASLRHEGHLLIKASGIPCGKVDPNEHIVSVRIADGRHKLGLKPSTDTDAHRYIYKHLPDIGGIVHTHSTYATAFAVAQLPIPCVATAIADEFGGDIPLSAYCEIGGEDIGKEVVRIYESTKCPAILIRSHGVFTIGKTVDAAVKSAIMLEECAKQVAIAMQFKGASGMKRLTDDQIAANFKRYHESYGQ